MTDYRNERLAKWERDLLGRLTARATFTRTDGSKVTLDNVRVESISPNGTSKGVIAVEFENSDRVVHLPFVSFWEIDYR